jgi:hypothetical protein
VAVTWKKLAYEDDVITKALLTAKGDIIYASAAGTPAALAIGSDNHVLTVATDVPNWEAGGGGGGGATPVVKTADETVNNSAVLQNDDELLLAVGANEDWVIDLYLIIETTGVADFKWAFTVPTGGVIKGVLAFASTIVEFDATAAKLVLFGFDTAGAGYWVRLRYIGGANAGNIQLQWAQNTAQASDTKVLEGSYILCHELT